MGRWQRSGVPFEPSVNEYRALTELSRKIAETRWSVHQMLTLPHLMYHGQPGKRQIPTSCCRQSRTYLPAPVSSETNRKLRRPTAPTIAPKRDTWQADRPLGPRYGVSRTAKRRDGAAWKGVDAAARSRELESVVIAMRQKKCVKKERDEIPTTHPARLTTIPRNAERPALPRAGGDRHCRRDDPQRVTAPSFRLNRSQHSRTSQQGEDFRGLSIAHVATPMVRASARP